MAEQYGRAGKSAREMGDRRRFIGISIGVGGIVLIICAYLILTNPVLLKSLGPGAIGLFLLIIVTPNLVDRLTLKKAKEARRAYQGAKGEEVIGDLLNRLDETYLVLNDVESPYGNIDHIVISREHGIFLIETKSHRGRVAVVDGNLLVNGKPPEKDFINQALKNAFWLRDTVMNLLGEKPWITPILVFSSAFVVPTQPVKGIRITNKKYLLDILHRASRPNPVNQKVWQIRGRVVDVLAIE